MPEITDRELILILLVITVVAISSACYLYWMYRQAMQRWQQCMVDRVPAVLYEDMKKHVEYHKQQSKNHFTTVVELDTLLDTVAEEMSLLLNNPLYGDVCNRQCQVRRNIMNNDQLKYVSELCSTVKTTHELLLKD